MHTEEQVKLRSVVETGKSLKRPKEDLRQRAYLSTVTGGIDFGAQQVVGFIINPIMVAILGPVFYGVWKIISQLNNYMATGDISASQSLKMVIAKERTVWSDLKLKKSFTAAFYTVAFFLPVYIIAGAIIVWVAPSVAGVDDRYFFIVRISTAFLVLAFIINQLFSLFDSVLRGMNLAYKRMGIRAGITLFGGILTAGALYAGYGLPGIAFVKVLIALITGITLWFIVSKNVSWLGFAKVKLVEVIEFIKLSGLFMLQKLVMILDRSCDMVLLGILAGPIIVAPYAITKFLMNSVTGAIKHVMLSITPGFGKLMGENKYATLLKARSQIITLIWILGTAGGAVICMWNESFISLWVSPEYFAGHIETFFIVLIAMQMRLHHIDGSLIDMSLDLRKKILLTAISVIIMIGLAIILIPKSHIIGLLISILIGKVIITIGYAKIVGNIVDDHHIFRSLFWSRTGVVCTIILTASIYVGTFLYVDNWITLVIGIVVSFFSVLVITWFFAIKSVDRLLIIDLIKKIKIIGK